MEWEGFVRAEGEFWAGFGDGACGVGWGIFGSVWENEDKRQQKQRWREAARGGLQIQVRALPSENGELIVKITKENSELLTQNKMVKLLNRKVFLVAAVPALLSLYGCSTGSKPQLTFLPLIAAP